MLKKFFVGPMSKLIVDAVIEYKNNNFALIPSRRQIDYNEGYVNFWNTQEFAKYVKSKNKNIILCRDHAGPGQGKDYDDGFTSLKHDSLYFDIIHIDPWLITKNIEEGTKITAKIIKDCLKINDNLKFEIATEESIKYFSNEELNLFCSFLKDLLNENEFDKIQYLVIQSGTKLKGNKQIGNYNEERLLKNIEIAKKYNLLSKEHNGDYIDNHTIKHKFELGLNSINIAPEFGMIQTETIINLLDKNKIDKFFDICLLSKKWIKWVDDNFNPYENKIELIKICGHYVYSYPEFQKEIFDKTFENEIKKSIISKLNELNDIQ